jgi:hypothetical protein
VSVRAVGVDPVGLDGTAAVERGEEELTAGVHRDVARHRAGGLVVEQGRVAAAGDSQRVDRAAGLPLADGVEELLVGRKVHPGRLADARGPDVDGGLSGGRVDAALGNALAAGRGVGAEVEALGRGDCGVGGGAPQDQAAGGGAHGGRAAEPEESAS